MFQLTAFSLQLSLRLGEPSAENSQDGYQTSKLITVKLSVLMIHWVQMKSLQTPPLRLNEKKRFNNRQIQFETHLGIVTEESI